MALKPRAGRYMVSDGRGRSLDILPSGKMAWLYRYSLQGERGKVTLGGYPDLTLRKAREKRDELAAQVASGKSPAMEEKQRRAGRSTNPTTREFGEGFYKEQVLRRWKDPKAIRRYLDNEIFPTLGEKVLRDVNALDVQALVYRKRDNGQVQAAMQLRNVIKLMFAYAIETQLVTVNPAVMVATRYIDKPRKRSPSAIHSDPPCISFHTLRMASFVDRPRRYPKLASSNTGSKIGSSRLSNACWHTRS